MDRADVTVVCCYNDPKQYKKLVEDLARQHYDYTLIGIDNCRQQYSSCAKALNAATVQVKTEYVIYSHQDIELPDADMLGNFVDYLFMTQEEDILKTGQRTYLCVVKSPSWQETGCGRGERV